MNKIKTSEFSLTRKNTKLSKPIVKQNETWQTGEYGWFSIADKGVLI